MIKKERRTNNEIKYKNKNKTKQNKTKDVL